MFILLPPSDHSNVHHLLMHRMGKYWIAAAQCSEEWALAVVFPHWSKLPLHLIQSHFLFLSAFRIISIYRQSSVLFVFMNYWSFCLSSLCFCSPLHSDPLEACSSFINFIVCVSMCVSMYVYECSCTCVTALLQSSAPHFTIKALG